MSDKQQSYTLILPEGDSKVMVYPSLPEKLSLNDTPKEGLSETNFKKLWSLHPEEYGTVKMYGNEIATPRWQQTFGQDYYFSGMTHKAVPLEDDFLITDKLDKTEWNPVSSCYLFCDIPILFFCKNSIQYTCLGF